MSTTTLEIWKHEPDADVLIDRLEATQPLDIQAELRAWAASRGWTLREPVLVWCMRRDRLMVFYASNEESYEQAAYLLEAADVFAGAFRIPTADECARWGNDPATEFYVDDYQVRVP